MSDIDWKARALAAEAALAELTGGEIINCAAAVAEDFACLDCGRSTDDFWVEDALWWQAIVPEDRTTWPPLFKPVLVSQSGDEPEVAAFDTEDVDRLRIHYKNWEGKVYAGWSFLVFPPPPRSPRGAQ